MRIVLSLLVLMSFAPRAAGEPVAAQMAIPKVITEAHFSNPDCSVKDFELLKELAVVAALDEHRTLYLLPCYAGAYNILSGVYVHDKRYPTEARKELFATFNDAVGWTGISLVTNANFDPKTKTISTLEKARGLSDCGAVGTYQWSEYGFRLMRLRYWGKCDGTKLPEAWPVVYEFKPAKQ